MGGRRGRQDLSSRRLEGQHRSLGRHVFSSTMTRLNFLSSMRHSSVSMMSNLRLLDRLAHPPPFSVLTVILTFPLFGTFLLLSFLFSLQLSFYLFFSSLTRLNSSSILGSLSATFSFFLALSLSHSRTVSFLLFPFSLHALSISYPYPPLFFPD